MTDASPNGFDMPPTGWQALVNEVHARIEAVDAAMANLRVAVRYLENNASREGMTAFATPNVEARGAAPQAETAAAEAAAKEAAEAKAAAEQEAARAEVRKAVEAARQDLNPYGFNSDAWAMPRDIWPSAPLSHSEPAAPPPTAAYESTGDPARDEVRRAVEEAKARMASGELRTIDDIALEESKPEEVSEPFTDVVAETPADPDVEMPVAEMPAVESPVEETPIAEEPASNTYAVDEAAREEAKRAVEAAKAQISPTSYWASEPLSLADVSFAASSGQSETPAPSPLDEMRRAVEEAKASVNQDLWTQATETEKPTSTAPSGDEARDEVRRAVEEAKAQIARGDLSKPSLADIFETMAKRDGDSKEGSPAGVESLWDAPAVEDTTPSVADLVSSLNATDWSKPATEVPAEDLDADAQREAVRAAVEAAKAEMEAGAPPEAVDDEEAAREEVRRAVAQMRNEMDWGSSPAPTWGSPDSLPVSTWANSAPAPTWGSTSGDSSNGNGHASADADDPDAKRDEVRRMVEAARNDINRGGLAMYDETAPPEADGLKPEETQSLFAAFAGADTTKWKEPDLGLPPSIVIEDPEGRVELARVYDTLNRVDRSQAALLNYTPHSVTVGLTPRERLPEPAVMIAAVRDAFGRGCKVTTEGVKMSVKIGEGDKAA